MAENKEIWKPVQQPEESWGQWTGRTAARLGARAGEAIVGLPGAVMEIPHALGLTEGFNENLPNPFPTPQKIREKVTKPLTGEYLEPRGKGEEFSDEVAGDLATFLLPVKGKLPLKSAISRAIGGAATSWLAKELGAGEGVQAAVKIGTHVAMGTAGTRKALIKNQNILKESAEKYIRPMEKAPAKDLASSVDKARKFALHGEGLEDPVKKYLMDRVESVEKALVGNHVDVKKAFQIEEPLAKKIRTGDVPKEAVKYVDDMYKKLQSSIHDYGIKENPEFYKYYKPWADVDNGLNAASKAGRFIQNKVKYDFVKSNKLTQSAFGALGYFKGIPAAVKTAALAEATKGSYNLFSLLGKSKFARTAYFNAIKAAMAGSKMTTLKNIEKFNSEADKYFPREEIWNPVKS